MRIGQDEDDIRWSSWPTHNRKNYFVDYSMPIIIYVTLYYYYTNIQIMLFLPHTCMQNNNLRSKVISHGVYTHNTLIPFDSRHRSISTTLLPKIHHCHHSYNGQAASLVQLQAKIFLLPN